MDARASRLMTRMDARASRLMARTDARASRLTARTGARAPRLMARTDARASRLMARGAYAIEYAILRPTQHRLRGPQMQPIARVAALRPIPTVRNLWRLVRHPRPAPRALRRGARQCGQ